MIGASEQEIEVYRDVADYKQFMGEDAGDERFALMMKKAIWKKWNDWKLMNPRNIKDIMGLRDLMRLPGRADE